MYVIVWHDFHYAIHALYGGFFTKGRGIWWITIFVFDDDEMWLFLG